LLLRRDPGSLTALAANGNVGLADAALNYTVAHGTQAQALAAVGNRGKALHPVWRPASASLVETYFASAAPSAVRVADFNESLAANSTIGMRLGAPADPARQLTGDSYFYYASRFGIYLSTVRDPAQRLPDAEDFLPAELEGSPATPEGYLNLARSYVEAHNIAAAVEEYGHALELSPSDAAIEDELAATLYRVHRHDEALAHWTQSLTILGDMQRQGTYPESWFTSFATISRHLGEYHLTANLQAEIEGILGPYVAKNGSYRSNELLKAVYKASASPAEGAQVIVSVANSASDPGQILDGLSRETWLSETSREPILIREIELVREHPADDSTTRSIGTYQKKLIELELDRNEVAKAQAVYESMAEKDRKSDDADGIVLAVRGNRVQAMLDAWRANPEMVPNDALGPGLYSLMKPTAAYKPNLTAIRPLREFVFEFKRQNDSLVSTDFLALAQLRIDTGDLPGALELLHSLAQRTASNPVSGAMNGAEKEEGGEGTASIGNSSDGGASDPYVNTNAAASLLEKNHLAAEAVPFLESLVACVPWDGSYRLRLAEAELTSNARDQARTTFLVVARDATAPYDLRVKAARALASMASGPVELGSGELSYLAHPSSVAAARQPYAAAARMAAAGMASASAADRESLLREAIAIHPEGRDAARAGIDLLLLQPADTDASATLAIVRALQKMEPANAIGEGDAHGDAIDKGVDRSLLPPGSGGLDLAAKIRLTGVLASANERYGNLTIALRYAELGISLAKDSPHAELTNRRDELKTALLLAQRNRLRLPNLRATLEQSKQVRPRVTSATIHEEDSQ
jgi:tetratricopeptide (TPR) repeat protein